MEVTASERYDFSVGRVIGRFGRECHDPRGNDGSPLVLQQQRLLVSGTHDKDRLAMFQRLIDLRKEGRIVLDLA